MTINNTFKLYSTFKTVGIYLLFGVLFFSCTKQEQQVINFQEEEDLPLQTGKKVVINYTTLGKIKFRLSAEVLHQFGGEKSYDEMPEGLHIEVFDSLGQVTTDLKANYGIRYTAEGKMEAKEDVIVTNEKGETLNTEHLVWDEKSETIRSDVFVKITTKEQVLLGDGLVSNQDFTDYKILKPRGVININADEDR